MNHLPGAVRKHVVLNHRKTIQAGSCVLRADAIREDVVLQAERGKNVGPGGCEHAMPSKISVYSEFNLPFIWIGNENANTLFLSEQLNFTRIDDNSKNIRSALLDV